MNFDLNQIILPAIFILALAVVCILVYILLQSRFLRGRIIRALNMKLFLVTLPREMPKAEEQFKKQQKEMIAVAEQFFSDLAQIKPKSWWEKIYYGPPHIVFEIGIPYVGERNLFLCGCSAKISGVY